VYDVTIVTRRYLDTIYGIQQVIFMDNFNIIFIYAGFWCPCCQKETIFTGHYQCHKAFCNQCNGVCSLEFRGFLLQFEKAIYIYG
jgi:aminopeptidase-like protein